MESCRRRKRMVRNWRERRGEDEKREKGRIKPVERVEE